MTGIHFPLLHTNTNRGTAAAATCRVALTLSRERARKAHAMAGIEQCVDESHFLPHMLLTKAAVGWKISGASREYYRSLSQP
jgi:hypothetical protein